MCSLLNPAWQSRQLPSSIPALPSLDCRRLSLRRFAVENANRRIHLTFSASTTCPKRDYNTYADAIAMFKKSAEAYLRDAPAFVGLAMRYPSTNLRVQSY